MSTRGPHSQRRLAKSQLVALLAPTLGIEKGAEVVGTAASRLGYLQDDLDRTQALAVMDSLANGDDLVGIVAQFAKARLILLF
jgi:hypothetical protein